MNNLDMNFFIAIVGYLYFDRQNMLTGFITV